ncbi:MAG TPA: hypothetical protein VGT08_04165 [Terracidiphilus sp.]|nr:hypothetical protein [Terracidiphilus sp.]
MKLESPVDSPEVSTGSVLEHLDGICASPFFISSKRCQQFLRYVVLETINGRAEQIKERNIAHEVFGKGSNFEPGEYSLVRVKAGEVRKRLSEYYASAPEHGLRIELPVGSYVPRIQNSRETPPAVEPVVAAASSAQKAFDRRRFGWLAGGTLGILGAASLVPLYRRKTEPLDLLWRPVFATKAPLLIFIPVMRERDGDLTEWVGIGPAAAMRRAADFLTEHHYPYHLRFGAELTFAQLREQPSLLLGGYDVDWTLRMTRDLRFVPLPSKEIGKQAFIETGERAFIETGERAFIDRQTNQIWKPVQHPPNPYVDVDYGILCRLFDSTTGQIVFLAVGTQTFGTEGAANLLFYPELFSSLMKQAPSNWETKNFQAVIRVSVIGTTPSTPQLVASYFW